MIFSLKNVLCGVLVFGSSLQAAVVLQQLNPIKQIDGLNYGTWQKAGIKSALGLAGTVGFMYAASKVVADGKGDLWYNGPNANQLIQAVGLAGLLWSASPIVHEINDELGNGIDSLVADLPLMTASGMVIGKVLEQAKIKTITNAHRMVLSLAVTATMRKSGSLIIQKIS